MLYHCHQVTADSDSSDCEITESEDEPESGDEAEMKAEDQSIESEERAAAEDGDDTSTIDQPVKMSSARDRGMYWFYTNRKAWPH